MNTRKRLGWLELIEGILLLILGIITLFQPREALRSFVAVYGIIALLTGLVDIAFYIVMERHTGFGPTISLVTGILSVLAGCALIAHPEIGLNLLLIIFPIWFLTHCISRLTHLNIVRLVAGKGSYYLSDADRQRARHRAGRADALGPDALLRVDGRADRLGSDPARRGKHRLFHRQLQIPELVTCRAF